MTKPSSPHSGPLGQVTLEHALKVRSGQRGLIGHARPGDALAAVYAHARMYQGHNHTAALKRTEDRNGGVAALYAGSPERGFLTFVDGSRVEISDDGTVEVLLDAQP